MQTISKEVFVFLEELRQNNNREWFNDHKDEFKILENQMKTFYADVENLMNKHDDIQETKAYRIYRDLRFSKDKTPFNPRFSAYFGRRKPNLRGGYFLRVEAGGSLIGTGFWNPNRDDVKRVRQEWAQDGSEIQGILNAKDFKNFWGEMQGEKLKKAPSGFESEHPMIDLINFKQWRFLHTFSDDEVLSKDFAEKVDAGFQLIRPFFDHMTEVLTTDENGISLF